MPRYRCLVLDHDDTAVMSTPCIHYPSFVDTLRHLRPEAKLSMEEFVKFSFDPGFEGLCYDIYGFSEEEMAWQLQNWKSFVSKTVPVFHPGMKEMITRFRDEGGILCVVSHAYSQTVLRDYAAASLPAPDCVLGWELGSEKQKPHPWPLLEIMRRYGLSPKDILVADDLKPGFDMARAVGCDYAAALWAYENEEIRSFMKKGCGGYAFESVKQLEAFLLG